MMPVTAGGLPHRRRCPRPGSGPLVLRSRRLLTRPRPHDRGRHRAKAPVLRAPASQGRPSFCRRVTAWEARVQSLPREADRPNRPQCRPLARSRKTAGAAARRVAIQTPAPGDNRAPAKRTGGAANRSSANSGHQNSPKNRWRSNTTNGHYARRTANGWGDVRRASPPGTRQFQPPAPPPCVANRRPWRTSTRQARRTVSSCHRLFFRDKPLAPRFILRHAAGSGTHRS